MIILAGKTSRVIKGLVAPEGFILAYQEKAWMTTELTLRWVKEIWLPYTQRKEALLVLDHFSAHLAETVAEKLSDGNTFSAVIPGGCTSVLQPLDVALNKPFKSHICNEWLKFMEQSVAALEQEQMESDDPFSSESESELDDGQRQNITELLLRRTKPMAVKPASKQTLVNWVETAWNKLKEKPDMVAKSFVVTGITPKVDGSESDLIRNDELQLDIERACGDEEEDVDSDNSGEESTSNSNTD